ncbi:hypothetical protein MNKW57_03360 [Biformimicrobium ophioploci]|uniref:Uncharacterized protein n=1 Tax=Biformimicrobium ophioploci TaxID=3036711 RepID=A0ABQ6LVB9_9GAMM|nr:hypothetical protein MNKW57_03360 [Microbulbifer sp. NKW57]
MKGLRKFAALLGVACTVSLVATPVTVSAADRINGEGFATRSMVIAKNGMAATAQPLATQVALDVLKKGAVPSMRQLLPMPCSVWWSPQAVVSAGTCLQSCGTLATKNCTG